MFSLRRRPNKRLAAKSVALRNVVTPMCSGTYVAWSSPTRFDDRIIFLATLRLTKCLLVAGVALFALLVALNNITDYESNFQFVKHVLSMDTTFEGNTLMWRAIETPWLHHLAYWMIIAVEALTGVLCGLGSVLMFMALGQRDAVFQRSKNLATIGLTLGICLWFTGFMTVGAEWFLMWQSASWNGQEAAFRFIMILFAMLLFLHQPEPDQEL